MTVDTTGIIYLDNHATTRVDPRVVQTMLPWFESHYGNAGSITHAFGAQAREAVEKGRGDLATLLHAEADEFVFTSGATESNNLALRGVALRAAERGGRRHLISVVTEHRATLDPLRRLAKEGFEVTWLPVAPHGSLSAGTLDLQRLSDALRDDTLLVSVMWANNEIGVIQPLAEIARICHERGALLHSDATQAVGKLPLDLSESPVDLLSFSGHKLYGPKGIGALFVRNRRPRLRLQSLLDGGGQERGLRSGTLNVPGIVGLAAALRLCMDELPTEPPRLQQLRDQLWSGIQAAYGDRVWLNGPALSSVTQRLAGNLNWGVQNIAGETLMLETPGLAMSSGSACTSADPEPSHVLRALGLTEDQARSSLRIGLGRFNTEADIQSAVRQLSAVAWKVTGSD